MIMGFNVKNKAPGKLTALQFKKKKGLVVRDDFLSKVWVPKIVIVFIMVL